VRAMCGKLHYHAPEMRTYLQAAFANPSRNLPICFIFSQRRQPLQSRTLSGPQIPRIMQKFFDETAHTPNPIAIL